MQHLESQLGAVDVTLSTDVLDRIDEIGPPGVTLSTAIRSRMGFYGESSAPFGAE